MGPRVVVVGAGFGGLGAAHALRSRGITDVTVLERAAEVGGVWRENTYPGAACDVPSSLYSWSWAPNPRWPRRYSRQPEILDYLRDTARHDGLLDLVRTGSDVTSVVLDEHARTWRVRTAGGEVHDADVVVSAVGQLSNPVVPALTGHFDGPSFHTAQWRHDVDLTGRRVAVVGSGASAVQVVPAIVDRVASLHVFQRSAPYVVPKPDAAQGPRHHALVERLPAVLAAERRSVLWVTERLNGALGGDGHASRAVLAGMRLAWRAQLRRQVRDPALRARLVPEHPIGCKRVLFSNDWYPALARPHVALVPEAVTSLEPTGVRTADGRLHEVDVVVWATGFAATRFLDGIEVRGRGGADLHRTWSGGARAHLGLSVPGFPNLFCIYGPGTNLGGSSIIAMMEAQAGYVAQVAEHLARVGPRLLEVRSEVAEAFDRELQERLAGSVWTGCDSWYRDGGRVTTNWPGYVGEYQRRTATVDLDQLVDRS